MSHSPVFTIATKSPAQRPGHTLPPRLARIRSNINLGLYDQSEVIDRLASVLTHQFVTPNAKPAPRQARLSRRTNTAVQPQR